MDADVHQSPRYADLGCTSCSILTAVASISGSQNTGQSAIAGVGNSLSLAVSPQTLKHFGLDDQAVALQFDINETEGVVLRSIHSLESGLQTLS